MIDTGDGKILPLTHGQDDDGERAAEHAGALR